MAFQPQLLPDIIEFLGINALVILATVVGPYNEVTTAIQVFAPKVGATGEWELTLLVFLLTGFLLRPLIPLKFMEMIHAPIRGSFSFILFVLVLTMLDVMFDLGFVVMMGWEDTQQDSEDKVEGLLVTVLNIVLLLANAETYSYATTIQTLGQRTQPISMMEALLDFDGDGEISTTEFANYAAMQIASMVAIASFAVYGQGDIFNHEPDESFEWEYVLLVFLLTLFFGHRFISESLQERLFTFVSPIYFMLINCILFILFDSSIAVMDLMDDFEWTEHSDAEQRENVLVTLLNLTLLLAFSKLYTAHNEIYSFNRRIAQNQRRD